MKLGLASKCWLAAVVSILLGWQQPLRAECVSLVKGSIAMDVESCGVLSPEKTFDLSNPRFKFIADLPAPQRKKFFDSYRGLVVKGTVARSLAVRSGLSPEKGVFNGEKITVFITPGAAKCEEILNKRVKGTLDEACCTGGGDVPCLLSSNLVLKEVKPIGKTGSGAGDQARRKANESKEYKKAARAYTKRDYKTAAFLFEGERIRGTLDTMGHYKLGHSFRELDQCEKAVPVLKVLFDKSVKNEFWADEADIIRKGNFMLARCYAKMNQAAFAVVILQGYLLEPGKYRKELETALKHKDFGWINTTKEFREFAAEAERKLGR